MTTSGTECTSPQAPWLTELLEAVAEFGSASLGLVAWELSLPEEVLAPAWGYATTRRLIEPASIDPRTGEQMFQLTERASAPR